METDFKLNFLVNQSAQTDLSSQTNLKTSENVDNKSFEKTLRAKKKEAEAWKSDDRAGKTKETRRNEKSESGRDKQQSRNTEKTEANETDGKRRTEKPESRAERKSETDKPDEAGMAKDRGKVEGEEVANVPEEVSDEIVALVAEALGVTPEQVGQALDEMGIKPEELGTAENVNLLIMSVKGIEEPSELLKMAELQETQKILKGIVEEALRKAEELNTSGTQAKASTQDGALMTTGTPEAAKESGIEVYAAVEASLEAGETAKAAKGGTQSAAKGTADIQNNFETEEMLENTVVQQNEQRTGVSGEEAKNGEGTHSGREGTRENAGKPQIAITEPSEQTPVIIQKADETVVEIGGKAVSRTPQRPFIQPDDVLNQIIDKMKVDFKGGSTEIKINLRPEELGNLTVRIATESGRVTAEIITENSKIKELVEENISSLKETLLKQGVEVGELSVSVGQQDGGDRMKQFVREQNKSHARMTQIINRITGEEIEMEQVNYANESEINGRTVDFSA